ncbi:MAG: NAD-dependent epimerase/dehydratase family protein [Thermodesulfobacteriales bacterium]|jgi:UDP-glucose 4-epimerase|nr:MAG: NAD-dependent epimerase/dehydratase family protein [Thermodesulfobacteriales bacterium]
MKILVTGGAGFIGSWVSRAFLKEGHEVVIIDDLSTGKEENLPSGAKFIKCDIRDFDTVEKIISDFKPEIVDHHAAQIDVRKSVDNPMHDAEINIVGTLHLIESSLRHGVKKFIFASTGGAIYGEPEVIPADEKTDPFPISPYGTSKYAVEKYLGYYNYVHGFEYVALRYANVYGPRQNPHGEAGVIAIFCNRILSGSPCTVFGDGGQTRDYVYVEDVAKANLQSLSAPFGSYNIGTGIETSVNDLISELKKSSGTDFEVNYGEQRPGEVQSISLEASQAEKILGWKPNVNLAEGIQKTWNWFNQDLK